MEAGAELSPRPAPTAVLFDALGTLVELEPPWPRLIDSLRAHHGLDVSWEAAKQAMLAEMTYYKQHHDEGRDAASLLDLRGRCAQVVRESLPQTADLSDEQLIDALLESLRFAPYPEVAGVLAELRSMGLKLAVVSNWDCTLRDTLGELGISGLIDAIVVSAEVGARKPAAAIFEAALEALHASPDRALCVGDSPETDIAGAQAAGIQPLLLDRRGVDADRAQMDRIFSLADLPGLIADRAA